MSYMDIKNLYANQDILMFKECYALEKIHGTSANISFDPYALPKVSFFSGGEEHEKFCALFNVDELTKKFEELFPQLTIQEKVIIHGEAYGGKQQGMSHTYGKVLKFIVFDVKIRRHWLSVPEAEDVAKNLGQEFVWYTKTSTNLEALNILREGMSVQAVRNGITEPKKWEGVVLRPLIELTKNNGDRIIAKHKSEHFSERKSKADTKVLSPEQIKVFQEAEAIAEEFVTAGRMKNLLSHLKEEEINIENTPKIIKLMLDDIVKEASGEYVDSKEARKAIGKLTVTVFKQFLQKKLEENNLTSS